MIILAFVILAAIAYLAWRRSSVSRPETEDEWWDRQW